MIAKMNPLVLSNHMQFGDYDTQVIGSNLNNTHPQNNLGLMEEIRKVVSIDYLKIDQYMKKKEEELKNVKATVDKLKVEAKGKDVNISCVRKELQEKTLATLQVEKIEKSKIQTELSEVLNKIDVEKKEGDLNSKLRAKEQELQQAHK